MADQNQQGQGGQQRGQQRPPQPRLVITHHEFGRNVKKPITQKGDLQNTVTIWVSKGNWSEQEEIFCSFRVNQGTPTQEQLLGEDGTCTEILQFQGMRPHVQVKLRWHYDANPQWRPLGYMEFKDPNRDPNDDLLFERLLTKIRNWLSSKKAQNQNNQP